MPPTTYDELQSILTTSADAQRADMDKYGELATQPSGAWSRDQAITATALSILPVLAGMAIRGKKGISAGAVAGLMGNKVYSGQIEEENKYNREQAKMKYDTASDLFKSIQDMSQKARLKESEIEAKRGAGAYDKNNEQKFSENEKLYIQGAARTSLQANAVLEGIASLYPDAGDMRLYDKNGKFNTDNFLNLLKDKGGSLLLGAETTRGQAERLISNFIVTYQKSIYGAQTSDKEYDRIVSLVKGEGITPATIPSIMEGIANIAENARRNAKGTLASSAILSEPGKKDASTYDKIEQSLSSLGDSPTATIAAPQPAQAATQVSTPPPGAMYKAFSRLDGKMHYVGSNREDLGVVE